MTKDKTAETEVVKIRLGVDTKKKLQEIAEREYRSLMDQCRLALDEWIDGKEKKSPR